MLPPSTSTSAPAEDSATKSDDTSSAGKQSPRPILHGNGSSNGEGNGNTSSSTNKRKRSAGTSSRGVANLTPDQLERKRANDREAQRAIRERTKLQIDRLNARILELESSQPYHDLQAVLRQKEDVIRENEEMKRQLASFMVAFGRFVNGPGQGLEELAAAAERNLIPYAPDPSQTSYPPPPVPDHTPPHSTANPSSPQTPTSAQRHTPQYAYTGPAPRSHGRATWISQNPSYGLNGRSNPNIHPDLASADTVASDERLNVDFLLAGDNQCVDKSANGVPSAQETIGRPVQLEPHSDLPRIGEPTCTLDSLLLDFLTDRQRMIAAGASSEILTGPAYPNFVALLNRTSPHHSHPLSNVFTDIISTFPDLADLPEQVAVVYIMFLIMRWCIEPTRQNYERLPEWTRPTATQRYFPHPFWIDFLPWPDLRDLAIQSTPLPPFESFFVPYTTTLRVNWPYASSDVLLPSAIPRESGSSESSAASASEEPIWRMNPVFESHIFNLDNWSLGPAFAEQYPEFAEAVTIK